jgi:hypothetical protein
MMESFWRNTKVEKWWPKRILDVYPDLPRIRPVV